MTIALDGDVLVAAAERGDLLDALARRDGSEHFTEAEFEEALDGLPREAPMRAYADLTRLLEIPEVRPFAELPWVAALRSAGVAVSARDGALSVEAVANTDPQGLRPADLPLPPGAETPDVVSEPGKVSGASANQSQTTAFLLDLVRAGFSDSDFVRDVKRVERALDIDFEAEVLRQFNGPSASLLEIDGEFAARSAVADPRRMATVMRRLGPDLGRLIQDLQGLQSEGLLALFLVAPDAPISPGILPPGRIEVETVDGRPDLYRVSGLAAGVPFGFPTPVPDEIYFGLIDEVFVVASSVAAAQQIVRADGKPPAEVEGASVVVGDLSAFGASVEDILGFNPGELGDLSISAEASLAQLWAELRLGLP